MTDNPFFPLLLLLGGLGMLLGALLLAYAFYGLISWAERERKPDA